MQIVTIYKRLNEILGLFKQGKLGKGLQKLEELMERLNYEIMKETEKEVDGKLLQHLMGWYLNLWEKKPPELYRYPKSHTDVIGRELKFLIKLYEACKKDIESLKRDYEEFKKTPGKDKSLFFFRTYYLPTLDKAFQEKRWTSKKFERGLEYYLQKEDLPL